MLVQRLLLERFVVYICTGKFSYLFTYYTIKGCTEEAVKLLCILLSCINVLKNDFKIGDDRSEKQSYMFII